MISYSSPFSDPLMTMDILCRVFTDQPFAVHIVDASESNAHSRNGGFSRQCRQQVEVIHPDPCILFANPVESTNKKHRFNLMHSR